MNTVALATVAGVAMVAIGSAIVGASRPWRRRAADVLFAARGVSPGWTGSAIGSEYISAAAFLGLAGMIVAFGADVLWYPIGAAAGYVVLLALIIAPLRRSGTYTLSDFAEWRLRSLIVRRMVTFFVTLAGCVYLLPQLHAAGLTLRLLTGAPSYAGGFVVALVVLAVAAAGGMRSTTGVQALQFWLKLAVLGITALTLFFAWRADGRPHDPQDEVPRFLGATEVTIDRATEFRSRAGVDVLISGELDGLARENEIVRLAPGLHRAEPGAVMEFPAGAEVPHIASGPALTSAEWRRPYVAEGYPLLATLSVLTAAAMGTMGLPHVIVRFYASRDGRAARRTILVVLALVGTFYAMTPVYGVLGRVYVPEVLLTGKTDEAVLLLPGRMLDGLSGDLLTGFVAAGAFAAFIATSSGILVAVGGTWSICFLGGGVAGFRVAVCAFTAVAVGLALITDPMSSPRLVMMAFAVSAATLAPLLVLGVWWRRLSTAGAVAGLVAGGGASILAVVAGLLLPPGSEFETWATTPAIFTVPLSFALMTGVSLLTPGRVPAGVARMMARMHLPDRPADHSAGWRDRSS